MLHISRGRVEGRGSTVGQLERIYKAHIDLLMAKLKASSIESECHESTMKQIGLRSSVVY